MLVALVAVLAAAAPEAQTEPLDLDSRLRFGFSIGEPLALTVASDLSAGLVLQSEIGLSALDDFSGLLAMDLVYRADQVFGPITRTLWLMPYLGAGVRVALGEGDHPDRFGFRVPAGISLRDLTEPIELFVQVAVGLSVLQERRGTLDFGGGLRVGF